MKSIAKGIVFFLGGVSLGWMTAAAMITNLELKKPGYWSNLVKEIYEVV